METPPITGVGMDETNAVNFLQPKIIVIVAAPPQHKRYIFLLLPAHQYFLHKLYLRGHQ